MSDFQENDDHQRRYEPLIECPDTGRLYEPLSRFRQRLGIADERMTPAPLPREGAPALEWCETHQRRHMAPGQGDPEPNPGAYLTVNYPPRLPRMAFLDPECGRELLVITIRGGKVCASYDDDDLDDAARLLVERAIALGELPDVGTDPVWHDEHTFRCAAACSSEATTAAGYVGPWHQLVDLGWHRNGEGAWECPAEHEVVSI